MDERDWTELLRMLLGMGLQVVSTDRATLTVTVQVPPVRATNDVAVREWNS